MRVLICGGRGYSNWNDFLAAMDVIHREHPIELVIHGAASGADTLADMWAGYARIPVISFPADWKKHGTGAGPIRNQQMLNEGKPDLVVAFPGGRGTENMILLAEKAGVEVRRVGR